ncbi:NADP-dependent oxidoreductase [Streptomyces arboris]|uniref:NADP-dependent oxidoreductase n=1 Tax=Streptomyces arboris TaxID=2600619 RepID=A0A5N5EE16_9ACTN|nr:NADP-dependent oxidoreductase [Streptomyces arboris]KAB2588687.1 NADP-dependent oxidoreductase [Streptomyces arboris]
MRAVTFSRHGDESVLELTEQPVPAPADAQLLIQVRAAGVNPVDWKFREGAVGTDRPFPLGMGWDVAGTVVATTADGPAVGDEVYGMLPLPYAGAYQEFAVLSVSAVAPKPVELSFAQAAAVPLAALTAWQSLDAAQVTAGQRVLVHGGAGGVGHFAVQLAKAWGAHVAATASPRNLGFLRRLGVDEPLDRTADDQHGIEPVDVVIDTVGGRTQQESWRLLRPGGMLITLPEPIDETYRIPGITGRRVIVAPDGEALRHIGQLIDSGAVQVEVQDALPLEKAAEAQLISRTGQVRGKLVLTL